MEVDRLQPGPPLQADLDELADRVLRKSREVTNREQQLRDAREELKAAQQALKDAQAEARRSPVV